MRTSYIIKNRQSPARNMANKGFSGMRKFVATP